MMMKQGQTFKYGILLSALIAFGPLIFSLPASAEENAQKKTILEDDEEIGAYLKGLSKEMDAEKASSVIDEDGSYGPGKEKIQGIDSEGEGVRRIKETLIKKKIEKNEEQEIQGIYESKMVSFYVKKNAIIIMNKQNKEYRIDGDLIVKLHMAPDKELYYYSGKQNGEKSFRIHKRYVSPLNDIVDIDEREKFQEVDTNNHHQVFIITEKSSLLYMFKTQLELGLHQQKYYERALNLSSGVGNSIRFSHFHFIKGDLALEFGLKNSLQYGEAKKRVNKEDNDYKWTLFEAGPSFNYPIIAHRRNLIKLNVSVCKSLINKIIPRMGPSFALSNKSLEVALLFNDSTIPQGSYWGVSVRKDWPLPKNNGQVMQNEYDTKSSNLSVALSFGLRLGKYL